MAPKFKFTRAEITDAAMQVVRRNGIGALTARAIADELGVSTQPVFTCFSTMAEARGAVRSAAESIYDGYVEEGLRAEIPFYGFGMQYIRFAREEPASPHLRRHPVRVCSISASRARSRSCTGFFFSRMTRVKRARWTRCAIRWTM